MPRITLIANVARLPKPNRAVDLSGRKFGRLTVLEYFGTRLDGFGRFRACLWKCRCECGKETIVLANVISRGNVKSCGCLHIESLKNKSYAPSKVRTISYRRWGYMMKRCYDKGAADFKNYGAKGIVVCEQWHDPLIFIKDMGDPPDNSYTLDRINPFGNYEPSNCRWATQKVQQNNRTNNCRAILNGENLTSTQWDERLGLKSGTVRSRLRGGWSMQRIADSALVSYEKK